MVDRMQVDLVTRARSSKTELRKSEAKEADLTPYFWALEQNASRPTLSETNTNISRHYSINSITIIVFSNALTSHKHVATRIISLLALGKLC